MQKGKAPTAAWASVREFRSVDLPEEGLPTIPISGSLGMREGRRVGRYMFSLVDAVSTPCTFFFLLFGMDSNCCEYLFALVSYSYSFFCFLLFSKPREAYERTKKKCVIFCFHSQRRGAGGKKKGR